jgi:Tfp pilus assembly protein PilX
MDKQRNPARTADRGIALLATLFALLLLSVIGLGMMYATNTETSINYNFRDKQVSFYAAQAGVQEGRERIKYPYNITPPTNLPANNAQNIIYIVSDASTVKPWLSGNDYFDTELCHENVMGVTDSGAGVPCPSNSYSSISNWYQALDDSLSAMAPWNLSNPDWKWTRIQLKANNNTPVPVNGNSMSYAQACWTGTNQISTPTGYT